jgi:hypothetical protein
MTLRLHLYPFATFDPFVIYEEVSLLSVREIAATKAYTIGRCGAYKDYIDLYFILSERRHHRCHGEKVRLRIQFALVSGAARISTTGKIPTSSLSKPPSHEQSLSASSKRTFVPMRSACSSLVRDSNKIVVIARRSLRARCRSPVHHNPTTSQVPAATKPAPAIREIRRPSGITFSTSTKAEIVAIHSTFITPPTNKSAINTQQQPTQ